MPDMRIGLSKERRGPRTWIRLPVGMEHTIYSILPSRMFRGLGIRRMERRIIVIQGRHRRRWLGQIWNHLGNRSSPTMSVFAEPEDSLEWGWDTVYRLGWELDVVSDALERAETGEMGAATARLSQLVAVGGMASQFPMLTPTDWESVEWTVRHLGFRRRADGRYELTNPHEMFDVPKGVQGAYVEELKRKAREAVARYRTHAFLESVFIRRVLCRHLKVYENHPRAWALLSDDFERFLKRVSRRAYPILGVESWGRQRDRLGRYSIGLPGVEVHESYSANAADSKWYFAAFRTLARRHPRAMFHCSIEVPESVLTRLHPNVF